MTVFTPPETAPVDLANRPKFQQIQLAFAQQIRTPQAVGALNSPGLVHLMPHIEPRRLAVYQQLIFNNIESFASSIFPVLKSVLGAEQWRRLVQAFIQTHLAQTPLFHEMGQEFIQFLEQAPPSLALPEFSLSLAHYEWLELAVMISEAPLQPATSCRAKLSGIYQLTASAVLVGYDWPVDQISSQFIPQEQPDVPTLLAVFRNAQDQVQFIKLTPLLYQLLSLLSQSAAPLKTHLQTLMPTTITDPSQFEAFALASLNDLMAQQLVEPLSCA